MKPFTCAKVRRRLHAFHDRELPVSEQIAVAAHLEWCGECEAALSEMELVRAMLQAMAHGRQTLSREDAAGFNTAVVNRLKAEQDASLFARLNVMFEDMHLVYVGLGATAATMACVIIMLGMMRFATIERPDSLAAIVNFLATPGSNENPVAVDGRILLPRALDTSFSAAPVGPSPTGSTDKSAEADTVFTLAAVVTREGRIANLELLHASGGQPLADEAKLVERLLDAVSRARFEPARKGGLSVAVNMVWLVAHTTVYANKNQPGDLPIAPRVKRRGVLRSG